MEHAARAGVCQVDVAEQIKLLNIVANQPEVLHGIAPGYESIDLTAFFNNDRNVLAGNIRGLVLFGYRGNGLYEMHYLFTNKLRGGAALRLIKDSIRGLFTYYNASAICGATPRDNLPARAVNRALGGRPVGELIDNSGRPCIKYMLERATWVRLSGA